MAALTAASWTVTITKKRRFGTKREVRGTLALAGTDTYPTGGVPLPSIQLLGLDRSLEELRIAGHTSATTSYKFVPDYAGHKLQIYEEEGTAAGGPLLEADTSEVPGPRTLDYVATGW